MPIFELCDQNGNAYSILIFTFFSLATTKHSALQRYDTMDKNVIQQNNKNVYYLKLLVHIVSDKMSNISVLTSKI